MLTVFLVVYHVAAFASLLWLVVDAVRMGRELRDATQRRRREEAAMFEPMTELT